MANRGKYTSKRRRNWTSNFPSYYRISLRWAMLVYKERENLDYPPLLNKIESVLGEDRNIVNSDGDRQLTVKILSGFIGKAAETDDQNIIIMTEFIEQVLPGYVKTFTEEGCETAFCDIFTKLVTQPDRIEPYKEMLDTIAENIVHRTIIKESEQEHGFIINFRRIGNSPYLRLWMLGYPDITKPKNFNDVEHFKRLEEEAYSFKLSGVLAPVNVLPHEERDYVIYQGVAVGLNKKNYLFSLEFLVDEWGDKRHPISVSKSKLKTIKHPDFIDCPENDDYYSTTEEFEIVDFDPVSSEVDLKSSVDSTRFKGPFDKMFWKM